LNILNLWSWKHW